MTIDIDEYLKRIKNCDEIIKMRQDEKKQLLIEIAQEYEEELKEKLDPDYKTGSTTFKTRSHKFTLTRPKRVDWDQDKLFAIWEKIEECGDDPFEYMTRKLSVSESKYKHLPESTKAVFKQARTVKAGSLSIKIEGAK